MKHIFHLTFALLAGMALCACSSDDPMDNDQAAVPVQPGETGSDDTWSVKIEGDMTRGLSLSGTTLTPYFKGEKIYVYYGNAKVGELTAPSGTGSQLLTGDQVLTGRLNDASYTVGQNLSLYFLKDKGFNDYTTGQDGTLATIASSFDYATATAQITGVDVNTHTLTISKATFTSQQAIIGFKFSIGLNSGDVITIKQNNASGTTKATVTSPAVTANSTVVYVALPLTASDAQYTYYFDIKRGSNAYCKGTLALGSSKKMKNGKYYSAQTVTLYKHMKYANSGDRKKYIATDGYIYSSKPSDYDLSGVIVCTGSNDNNISGYTHGIAMSLNNSGLTRWKNVNSTLKNFATLPSGASAWTLPSIDQWNYILQTIKGKGSDVVLKDRDEITDYKNVDPDGDGTQATNLNALYWSSTASGSSRWCYRANYGYKCTQGTADDDDHRDIVRGIFGF